MAVIKHGLAMVLLGLFLGGCASSPYGPAPVEDNGEPSTTAPEEPSTGPESDSERSPRESNSGWRLSEPPQEDEEPAVETGPAPAVVSLTRQARHLYDSGEYRRAIATSERALRIDRRHAELYLLLAQSYWQLAQPSQAEQFARQGLRYVDAGQALAESLRAVLDQVR